MEYHNSYLHNQPKKGETLYMNKKLIAILSSIIVLLLLASGLYYFFGSSNGSIKEEHTKYLALINEGHDFKGGLAGLETLDNDKGQEAFKNIKTEIKIAKELKNADSSLDNKDVDAAKKSLEKVDSLTTDNSFDKAIEWLREDVTNYEKVLKEIKEAKSDDINKILDKYKFKHSALKAKLIEGDSNSKNNVEPEKQNTYVETKPDKSVRKNTMGATIPDNVTSLQQEWIRRGGDAAMLASVRSEYKNVEKITTNFNSLHQSNPDDPITIYLVMKDGTQKTAEFDYAWASGAFAGYNIHVFDENFYISVN